MDQRLRNSGHLWVRSQARGELLPRARSGEGIYLIDDTGRRYIDGSSGPVLSCLGHGNREVIEAIKRQLDGLEFAFSGHFTTDPIDALAETVLREAGPAYGRIVFVSGGSEATETCIRIALQYHLARGEPARTRILSRRQSWHGYTFGALSVSGYYARRRWYAAALPEQTFLSPANAYRPPEGVAPEGIAAWCAAEFEREILRIGPERVAAFIFEPVTGTAGGAVPAPRGYAKAMREVCNRYGVLMISDEVMCGVGRCGTWRALEQDEVASDLMAIAKGLGGGYLPIGAAVFSECIYETIMDAHGLIGTAHTYGGHPVACAAALMVQEIIRRDGLVAKARDDGAWFMTDLRSRFSDCPHVGDVRGRGLLVAVEFVEDRASKRPFPRDLRLHQRIGKAAMERGLVCLPSGGTVDGLNGDHVLIAPPYTVTRDQLSTIGDILARSLDAALAGISCSSAPPATHDGSGDWI
jgi:adenosylmethionine-8-amino-7-oxononanoate aminotransferase